jgi:hypothetical protein
MAQSNSESPVAQNNQKEKEQEQDGQVETNTISGLNLRQLALPSEVKSLPKFSGAIYYSPSVKGKVLMPVHVWGEVNRAGLHFFPVDTSLIQGLSLSGGATANGVLDEVRVQRVVDGTVTQTEFNMRKGGDPESYNFKLKPGDTVFVARNRFYENRAYYTSLVGVIATVLSSILLYRAVRREP